MYQQLILETRGGINCPMRGKLSPSKVGEILGEIMFFWGKVSFKKWVKFSFKPLTLNNQPHRLNKQRQGRQFKSLEFRRTPSVHKFHTQSDRLTVEGWSRLTTTSTKSLVVGDEHHPLLIPPPPLTTCRVHIAIFLSFL
jgi:hypothetical protein